MNDKERYIMLGLNDVASSLSNYIKFAMFSTKMAVEELESPRADHTRIKTALEIVLDYLGLATDRNNELPEWLDDMRKELTKNE